MSALQELIEKRNKNPSSITAIEGAVLDLYDAPEDWYKWAEKAAEELAEKDTKNAALTTRLQEAEAVIKPLAEVAKDIDSNVLSKNWSDYNRINLCGDEITAGLVRRAAAWLKGGTE